MWQHNIYRNCRSQRIFIVVIAMTVILSLPKQKTCFHPFVMHLICEERERETIDREHTTFDCFSLLDFKLVLSHSPLGC